VRAGFSRDRLRGEVDGRYGVGFELNRCFGVPFFVTEVEFLGVWNEGFGELGAINWEIGLVANEGY
jgi:hypothetical protein